MSKEKANKDILNIVIKLKKDNIYYKIIKEYAKKRELSPTSAAKQLLFNKIDELKKEVHEQPAEELKEIGEPEEPKKDFLRNLNILKNE